MIIVSDVCDTLYASNTTMDYCRYVLSKEKKMIPSFFLSFVTSRISPGFYACALVEKIFQKDIIKNLAVSLLKGLSKATLERYARDFVNEELKDKKNEKIFSLFAQYRPSMLILLSSSLDPIVAEVAKSLSADYASSRLEYKDGISTGRIAFEMKGRKHEILDRDFKHIKDDLMVVTDNTSDYELMKKARYRYAVVYRTEQKEFWKSLQVQTIDLNEK